MSSVRLSSSSADDDIGDITSIRYSRDEEYNIAQDTEFLVVKQGDSRVVTNVVQVSDFFIVKTGETRTVFSAEGEEVANLRDIRDINSTAIAAGIGTNFILTYDATEDNFKFISPDALVDSAVGDVSGPAGFSTTVINNLVDTLDVELDDKIDLDAGTWS